MLRKERNEADQIYKGIACICAAFFLITVMLAFGKLLADRHNAVEVVFWRNLIGVLPMAGYLLARRRGDLLKAKKPKALLARVVIGTAAVIPTFAATQMLPMSNATVLFFTSTLLIPVMAHFFLKERVGMHRWLAVGIGMSGVFLIAQPSATFNTLGAILALTAALGHATIQIMLRYLREESPFTVTFYFLLGGVIICGGIYPFVGTWPASEDWGIILALGSVSGLGQYLLTRAFTYAPASLLNPFNYTGLIWATGLDILIWNVVPGLPVFTGAAIIIAANGYIVYRERQVGKEC